MKVKKLLAVVLALTLAVAMFAGCNPNEPAPSTANSPQSPAPTTSSQPPSPTQSTQPSAPTEASPQPLGEPIKIGHIVDLQGPEAAVGKQAQEALEFAVTAMGGVFANRPVEIILGDAQGQPSVARDQAVKMVEQDKVVAIFGPTQMGEKSAVSDYMKEVEVPLIFYNPTPAGLIMGNPWLVGAGGASAQMPSVMGDYAYKELGYRTVHTIGMDNTGGRSFFEPFVEVFEKLGGKVLSQQWAPQATADFSPYFVTLSEADAIVAWTSGSDAIALWNAWFDLGINEKMPIVTPMHGGFTDYFIPLAIGNGNPAAAEAMLGTFAPMMYTYGIDNPANQEFVKKWTDEFGKVPGGTNMPGSVYQAMLLFKTAVEATNGDTDPDKLIEAIFKVDVTGPEGHLFFNNSHAATKDIYIVKLVRLADNSYNYEIVKVYKDIPPAGIGK